MANLDITLTFSGKLADANEIDLYDLAQALVGFQRSLALTTHLVLNDEIITQVHALTGAQIIALPPSEGSWKQTARIAVIAGALYHAGTAPKDTPLGHIISSAYDYVISSTLGFHVDYEKSLGQQYEELKKKIDEIKPLSESRLDSLVEKCENAIKEMHRPIAKSETASQAILTARIDSISFPLGQTLNRETYEYIAYTERSDTEAEFVGFVSSYNLNTFKGRIFVPQFGRPIPFELEKTNRNTATVLRITASLSSNAASRMSGGGEIHFDAYQNFSRSGRLKSFTITTIRSE
jgi:hypothetical protein